MELNRHILKISASAVCSLVAACSPVADDAVTSIVPAPVAITTEAGAGMRVADITTVYAADSSLAAVCGAFIVDAAPVANAIMAEHRKGSRVIVDFQDGLRPEQYSLTIGADSIVVSAADRQGAAHGLSTLRQLMVANAGARLPRMSVTDYPRWNHRGAMIDCSRHFWTVDELKRVIRAMAMVKLNVLHLHLSDNQGWRLYLDRHPDVTDAGTFYYDFPGRSGQYYTPDQLRELVAYAAARGIGIIPEIDMPGHCLALLAARPELSCRGGEFETYPDEREQKDRKRLGENMVCVGNEAVYDFVGDMLDQLTDIFPSEYIHLGGDEVSTLIWQTCPKCRSLFRREGMKDYVELQDYFTRRVSRMVRDRGRVMIGWEEINDRGAASDSDLITIWQGNPEGILDKAVERGMDVIMCPKDPCYFDFGYSRNPSRKVYEWDPAYGRTDSLALSHIRGGQACLWTEFVPQAADLELMLFPRLCALAEVLWSPAGARDWDSYQERMAVLVPQLEAMGVTVFDAENPDGTWFRATEHSAADVTLAMPAAIETNMHSIRNYEKEYAFDGDTTTFFSSPYSHIPGDYMTVRLDSAMELNSIRVIADLSREYFGDGAELSVSAGGDRFEVVATPDPCGQLHAAFDAPRKVEAVKIELTKSKNSRLTIKEIELK